MLLKLRHSVYESTVCEKAELYTCILQIRNARHNACRAFRTIARQVAIGWAVIGGYIRGRLRRIGAQRIAAQSPLYALFFPPLSFSRKKKVVKNEQPKYLSIYLDRGSVISSPLTQTKQITISPFQILLTAAARFDPFGKNYFHLQTPPRVSAEHTTSHEHTKSAFSEVFLEKPRRGSAVHTTSHEHTK